MAPHRDALPHTGTGPVLTDSGLETDLIFSDGFDLPHFASYPLLDTVEGRAALLRYFVEHVGVAEEAGLLTVSGNLGPRGDG